MDGVKSLAVQGHCYEERDNTQMHRGDLGEALKKNDKSRSWGRWDNEQRCRGESMCLCANWRGPKPRGTWGEAYCREPRKEGKKCSHRNGKTLTIIETESREKHTENL